MTNVRTDDTASGNMTISLEAIVIQRLRDLVGPLDPSNKLLRFPMVFGRICPVLCLKKPEAWAVLQRLQSQRRIEIVPYQGIRLLRQSSGRPPSVPNSKATRPEEQQVADKILTYLQRQKEAYPSDIAEALSLDIDTVLSAAKKLLSEGRIEV